MRTKITADAQGRVTMAYVDWQGERRLRTFVCPANGGYVRETYASGSNPQVCERLSSAGSTLSVSSRSGLLELIRREYRKMRRAEKREE
jgi:hypothetical protein